MAEGLRPEKGQWTLGKLIGAGIGGLLLVSAIRDTDPSSEPSQSTTTTEARAANGVPVDCTATITPEDPSLSEAVYDCFPGIDPVFVENAIDGVIGDYNLSPDDLRHLQAGQTFEAHLNF